MDSHSLASPLSGIPLSKVTTLFFSSSSGSRRPLCNAFFESRSEAQDFIPYWMLLSAAFGFIVGEACGGHARLRKYLEQANADLRNQLQNAQSCSTNPQCALAQQRRVIHDIHKRIVTVTKGLEKPTS